MLNHQHLIIRAEIESPPTESQLEEMNFWFSDLIHSIGMKKLSGPHTVYSNVVGNRGFTGVCVIETSHIALHTWDEDSPSIIQLDVYSCADLDIEVVFSKLNQFSPKTIEYTFIDRNDKLEIKKQGKLVI